MSKCETCEHARTKFDVVCFSMICSCARGHEWGSDEDCADYEQSKMLESMVLPERTLRNIFNEINNGVEVEE